MSTECLGHVKFFIPVSSFQIIIIGEINLEALNFYTNYIIDVRGVQKFQIDERMGLKTEDINPKVFICSIRTAIRAPLSNSLLSLAIHYHRGL